MAQIRPYRGIEAGQRIAERRRRLLTAGLDLLGAAPTPGDLTVRAICAQSGLAARYFYENFTDKDAFVSAVFDWVVADIAATTQAAVTAWPTPWWCVNARSPARCSHCCPDSTPRRRST